MKKYNCFLILYWAIFSGIAGCSMIEGIIHNNRSTQNQNLPQKVNNQELNQANLGSVEDTNFPKDTCGDSLPEDSRSYPIAMYPLYVEYSEKNLEIVKSRFCKDAFVKNVDGTQFIQVASFVYTSAIPNNSDALVNLLKREFPSLSKFHPRLVQSSVILEKPNNLQSESKNTKSTETLNSVSTAAKLASEQVNQLLSMGKVKKVGSEDVEFTLGILVPTYLPSGFEVSEVNVAANLSYHIFYQNSKKQCFTLEGFPLPQIGDEPTGFETVEAQSPILGRVTLEYTESDSIDGSSFVGTPGPDFSHGGFHAYSFNSPGGGVYNFPEKYNKKCSSISVQEAVKVVESLRYLNP